MLEISVVALELLVPRVIIFQTGADSTLSTRHSQPNAEPHAYQNGMLHPDKRDRNVGIGVGAGNQCRCGGAGTGDDLGDEPVETVVSRARKRAS